MYFEIYEQKGTSLAAAANSLAASTAQGKWRWRLCADNGEPIASGEGYHSEANCRHAIALVMSANATTEVRKV